jgi:hypothetical protein
VVPKFPEQQNIPHEVLSAVPQGSILATLPFTVFINDLCNAAKYSNDLLFGYEVKIYGEIWSSYDSWLLQSDTDNIRVWCISNYMKLNINESRVVSFFSRKTN